MGSNLQNNQILGLAFSRDGSLLAAGSATRGARLWNVTTGGESAMFQNENESVTEVAFSANGRTLIEVTRSRLVRLCDVATGRRRTLLRTRKLLRSAHA